MYLKIVFDMRKVLIIPAYCFRCIVSFTFINLSLQLNGFVCAFRLWSPVALGSNPMHTIFVMTYLIETTICILICYSIVKNNRKVNNTWTNFLIIFIFFLITTFLLRTKVCLNSLLLQ